MSQHVARCPLCGATHLVELAPHAIRCGHCGATLDRALRPLPPIQGGAGSTIVDELPTNPRELREEAEQTWMELDPQEEAVTDPRAHPLAGAGPAGLPTPPMRAAPPGLDAQRPSFAAPPPAAAAPFAAPPPKEAFSRDAGKTPWSRTVGDGGPPPGLDLLVTILAGLDVLSIGLWWRSSAPVAGCYVIPLGLSLFVVYFFWQGKNWARFLLMTGALIEIAMGALAFATIRRMMTGPEMLAVIARLAFDAYFIWFCVRPDTTSFFEKRSGRVKR